MSKVFSGNITIVLKNLDLTIGETENVTKTFRETKFS
jgi:hypothetical protein